MSIEANRTDLVVVGCGIAGLSAAVSGLQGGLQVTLLKRAPEAEFGGNTRWTEAYVRMKNDAEISHDFEEHFAANGRLGGFCQALRWGTVAAVQAMMSSRLSKEQRRVLVLLADARNGINKALLVHGHGFSRRMLAASRSAGLWLRDLLWPPGGVARISDGP